jgi:hypothetical protein
VTAISESENFISQNETIPKEFFTIQEVAEPQMMSMMSDAQPFQNCSRAEMKCEPLVSNQGASSFCTGFQRNQGNFNTFR